MIDPYELVDDLVAALQDIADLVAAMGADASRIFAYRDSYPKKVSLVHAIHTMPAPGCMAVWQGTQPGSFGGMDVWKHQVTLFLRVGENAAGASPYYALFRLITKGTPATTGDIQMINLTVNTSCYPMDLPQIQRQTDAEGLDYFEMPLSFTEIGDD
jgi:hypothetical protein